MHQLVALLMVTGLTLPAFGNTGEYFHCANAVYQVSAKWKFQDPADGVVKGVKPQKMWFEHPALPIFLLPPENDFQSFTVLYGDKSYQLNVSSQDLDATFSNSHTNRLDHYGLEIHFPNGEILK